MTETIRYRGVITIRDQGESMYVLFLEGEPWEADPLAEILQDDLDDWGRYASVRYWLADAPLEDDALIELSVRVLCGEIESIFHPHYSERTGYLWTDEDIVVGGHDLLSELSQQVGKYCLLEVTYSQEEVPESASLRRGSRNILPGSVSVHVLARDSSIRALVRLRGTDRNRSGPTAASTVRVAA